MLVGWLLTGNRAQCLILRLYHPSPASLAFSARIKAPSQATSFAVILWTTTPHQKHQRSLSRFSTFGITGTRPCRSSPAPCFGPRRGEAAG